MNSNVSDHIRRKESLDFEKAKRLADDLLNQRINDDRIEQVLIKLSKKGETHSEIAGFAAAMKSNSIPMDSAELKVMDTCGTGGDGLETFNISTAVALVLASYGIKIAKHGNRSVSSKCGSADVLEAMGIKLTLSSEQATKALREVGFTFLFAQVYHPKMKNLMPIRKKIGKASIFNIIGPLSSPVHLNSQVIGVYDQKLMRPVIEAMKALGLKSGAVVHGYGGMDELSLEGENQAIYFNDIEEMHMILNPKHYGMSIFPNTALKGGEKEENANIMYSVMKGEESAHKEAVIFNTGFALLVNQSVKTIREGIDVARNLIDSGKALEKIEEIKAFQIINDSEKDILDEINREKRKQYNSDYQIKSEAIDAMLQASKNNKSTSLKDGILEKLKEYQAIKEQQAIKECPMSNESHQQGAKEPSGFIPCGFDPKCIKRNHFPVIGEFKKGSPSKGYFGQRFKLDEVLSDYNALDLIGISVLADEKYFYGGIKDVAQAFKHTELPILFKEFIVSEQQIALAKTCRASAVLIIARILSRSEMERLIACAHRLELEVLLEIHNQEDYEKAKDLPFDLLGINNRNLKTFETSIEHGLTLYDTLNLKTLAQPVISESGISCHADMTKLMDKGFSGFLIGEHLIKSVCKKKTTPLVKMCGIKTIKQAEYAASLGVDMIGYVFAKSKRQLSLDEAKHIQEHIKNTKVKTVGVMVNPTHLQINQYTKELGLDYVQIHGVFHDYEGLNKEVSIIRAHGFDELQRRINPFTQLIDLDIDCSEYDSDDSENNSDDSENNSDDYIKMHLIDSKCPGSGEAFDWNILNKIISKKPVLVAGGLNDQNIKRLLTEHNPFGVDVSSGIEVDGVKNKEKMYAFMASCREELV